MREVELVNTDIMALVKDIQDRISEVAYMMWESAGRQHGMAMEYWLQAEREVLTTMQAATERMMPDGSREGGDAPPKPAADTQAAATPAAPAKQAADKPAPKKRAPAKKPAAAAKSASDEPATKPAARKAGTRARGKTTPEG